MTYKMLAPFCIIAALCGCMKAQAKEIHKPQSGTKNGGSSMVTTGNTKEIYLAGGCFWGVEGYFRRIAGVVETDTGYANGTTDTTNYQQIHGTDHAETVKIRYNTGVVALEELLEHYFRIIDPLSVNKQGNDVGRQYRTGIYYTDSASEIFVEITNCTPMKYHGVTCLKEREMEMCISAYPLEEGIFFSSSAIVTGQKQTVSVLFIKVDLADAFKRRTDALYEWFLDQINN